MKLADTGARKACTLAAHVSMCWRAPPHASPCLLAATPAASAASGMTPKLFLGMLPFQAAEADIRPHFEKFGTIEDVIVLRHNDTGKSKGCVLRACHAPTVSHTGTPARMIHIIFSDTSCLSACAMNALFLIYSELRAAVCTFHPSPFVLCALSYRTCVFFALRCGFVRFTTVDACNAAIAEHNGKLVLPGGNGPITVKFADTDRQKAMRRPVAAAAPLTFGGFAQPAAVAAWNARAFTGMPGMYGMPAAQQQMRQMQQMQQMQMRRMAGGYGMPGAGMAPAAAAAAAPVVLPPQLAAAGVQSGRSGVGMAPEHQGPANANVFVYNLPRGCTDVDLYVAFASFGTVYSAKVFTDKQTGASKGFGFVSYQDPRVAAQAIHAMHGYVWQGQRLRVSLKTARAAAQPY